MNDVIGIGYLNDLVAHKLRAELAKRYGVFGEIPMFGGIKLHEYYPPLTSILLRTPLLIILPLYIALTPLLFGNLLVGILFSLSFINLWMTVRIGRISESLGFICAIAIMHPLISSTGTVTWILPAMAGLFHPTSLMIGILLFTIKTFTTLPTGADNIASHIMLSGIQLAIAFCILSLWYVPFYKKHKNLPFIKEKRNDKLLGVYYITILSALNVAIFALLPSLASYWFIITLPGWLLPLSHKIPLLHTIRRKISYATSSYPDEVKTLYTVNEIPKLYPKIQSIKEPVIIIKSHATISTNWELWAITLWLLTHKNIIVWNGMIQTETPQKNLTSKPPDNLPVYEINNLK